MKGYESKKLMKQTTCENAAKELTAQNGAAALATSMKTPSIF